MALYWSSCPAVQSIPGKRSGAWVLRGTRMPLSVIFENLQAGAKHRRHYRALSSLDRNQIKAVIEFPARGLDGTSLSARPKPVVRSPWCDHRADVAELPACTAGSLDSHPTRSSLVRAQIGSIISRSRLSSGANPACSAISVSRYWVRSTSSVLTSDSFRRHLPRDRRMDCARQLLEEIVHHITCSATATGVQRAGLLRSSSND